MKKIIFILIILSVYGCGLQRRTYCERKADKVARILKDCPGIIDTITTHDTITVRDSVTIYLESEIDTAVIDSLLSKYCDALRNEVSTGKTDTVTIRLKEKIYFETSLKKRLGTGERLLVHEKDTIILKYGTDKNDNLELKIISIKKEVNTKQTIVTPCPSCELTLWQDFKQNGFKWLIIFVSGIIVGFFILLLIKILL